MLDVAIIGGGLCGLALAHSLQSRGQDWRLFEARERLGGRVLTGRGRDGTPVDLGATWYWPETQPGIAGLVQDLGLRSHPQPDDGRVLHLRDPNQPPAWVALGADARPADDDTTPATPGAVHGGAWRIEGGATALIEALSRPLPAERVRRGHGIEALIDHGDFVELRLRHGEAQLSVQAQRVVLAMPPRVAAALRYAPTLPDALQAAMAATPTWMATAAKAGLVYPRAVWRDGGRSGNAWVTHAQAMLAEVFDASGPDGRPAALAGFVALPAAQRGAFRRSRELLLDSQAVQLWGESIGEPEVLWQDWAEEPQTCSPADLAEEAAGATGHPSYGDPLYAEPWWHGRLYFGGSETARRAGGYMEGALGAAARLRRQLAPGVADLRSREAANASAR